MEWTTDYNCRSIAETVMYRVKQLFGESLTLRDYDDQVVEAMVMVRALNKMTKAGMPENTARYGDTCPKSDLFNKALSPLKGLWNRMKKTRFFLMTFFMN